jgi:hypothetical protein
MEIHVMHVELNVYMFYMVLHRLHDITCTLLFIIPLMQAFPVH